MPNLPEGLSNGSEPVIQSPAPTHRPLGVTLIVLYYILVALEGVVAIFAPSLITRPGASTVILLPMITIPFTLFLAWGLWHCYGWARTIIICIGIPTIPLSFLSGTAGFKTWLMLIIVLYLFQRRIGDIFSPVPDPQS